MEVPLYLFPSELDPNVTETLRLSFNSDLAAHVLESPAWTQSVLKDLVESSPATFYTPESADQLLAVSGAPPMNGVILAGCTPNYCTGGSSTIRSKLIVMVWPVVTDDQKQAAQLSPDTTIGYTLLRQTSAKVVELLRRPPVPVMTTGGLVMTFVDVLGINTAVQYYLGCYTGSDYASSTTKSPLTSVSLSTGDYSEAFCRTIPPPSVDQLPRWMWRNDAGMCDWQPNNQSARDYYCMVTGLGSPAFDSTAIQLANLNSETCSTITPSTPSLITNFTPYNEWAPDVCLTGRSDSATVQCNTARAGDSDVTNNNFQSRVGNAYTFYTAHGSEPVDMSAISTYDARQSLWNTNYEKCGPLKDPNWATTKCAPDDLVCAQLLTKAGCDRNACAPWRAVVGTNTNEYSRQITAYPSSSFDGASSTCCNTHGSYMVNTTTGSDRGRCGCTSNYGGDTCQYTECAGVTCDGNGTCRVDANNKPYCTCLEGYYNVDDKPVMKNDLDCANHTATGDTCDLYSYDATGKPIRNPDCILGKCTCPVMCDAEHPDRCIQTNPLRCVRNVCNCEFCDMPTVTNGKEPGLVCDYKTGCVGYQNGTFITPNVCDSTPTHIIPAKFYDPLNNNFTCEKCWNKGAVCDTGLNCCSNVCSNRKCT